MDINSMQELAKTAAQSTVIAVASKMEREPNPQYLVNLFLESYEYALYELKVKQSSTTQEFGSNENINVAKFR